MDNGFPREAILKTVTENLSHADVQAYLNHDDPRHDRIVAEVTELVEQHFGESSGPRMGLMDSSEREVRQSLYNDPRSVDDQIRDILGGHDPKWSKAYVDSGHPQHVAAVQRVTILSEAKFGDELHAPEVMPIVTKTGD